MASKILITTKIPMRFGITCLVFPNYSCGSLVAKTRQLSLALLTRNSVPLMISSFLLTRKSFIMQNKSNNGQSVNPMLQLAESNAEAAQLAAKAVNEISSVLRPLKEKAGGWDKIMSTAHPVI